MFQLDEAVRAWCASALPESCGPDERLDELEDHLRSEIERRQHAGASEEEAFTAATRRMGEATALVSEFTKNRSFASRLCAADRQLSGVGGARAGCVAGGDSVLRKQARRLILGHAILWASAMIATGLMLRNGEDGNSTLPLLMVSLWFGSYLLLTQAFRALGRRP